MNALEKIAAKRKLAYLLTPAIGGGLGYLKGEDFDRGGEGAARGALGAFGGGVLGGLGGLAIGATGAMVGKKRLAESMSKLPKGARDRKMMLLLGGPAAVGKILGAVGGYKALTKGVDSPKKKTAGVPLDLILGGGLGYLKGEDFDRGGEGAIRGGLGAAGGAIIGERVGGLASILAMKGNQALRGGVGPMSHRARRAFFLSSALGSALGSIGGYTALTKKLDRRKS